MWEDLGGVGGQEAWALAWLFPDGSVTLSQLLIPGPQFPYHSVPPSVVVLMGKTISWKMIFKAFSMMILPIRRKLRVW